MEQSPQQVVGVNSPSPEPIDSYQLRDAKVKTIGMTHSNSQAVSQSQLLC